MHLLLYIETGQSIFKASIFKAEIKCMSRNSDLEDAIIFSIQG